MKIYQSKFRFASLPLALLVLIQSLLAAPIAAQSAGPVQPEFQQTSVVGADNLVDPFTGNFNYTIPLMEIGGFPLTLSYSSDHKMEEEASWVGFGWTLNPGAISRQVRGLPDDFRGDEVVHNGNMAPSVTTGIAPGLGVEIFGGFGLSSSLNFSYNNYSGFSFTRNLSPSINITKIIDAAKGKDSNEGSASKAKSSNIFRNYFKLIESKKLGASLGTNINSRAGIQEISFGGSYKFFANPRGAITFGDFSYTPVSDLPQSYDGLTFDYKIGVQRTLADAQHATLSVSSLVSSLQRKSISQPAYGYLYLQDSEDDELGLQDYNKDQGGLNLRLSPRIPMAYGTPDVFSVSGPGLTGQIKVSRNDLGLFRPADVKSNSNTDGISYDLGIDQTPPTPGAQLGLNYRAANIVASKGAWKVRNELQYETGFGFQGNIGLKESAFMHFVGEPTAQMGKTWYQIWEEDRPLGLDIESENGDIWLRNRMIAQNSFSTQQDPSISLPISEEPLRQRRPRSQQVTYLTAAEARDAALSKTITDYETLDNDQARSYAYFSDIEDSFSRTAGVRQGHHLSEIKVTSTGGQRFVYGLPSYNLLKKEVTFNADGLDIGTEDENRGIVRYSGTDNTVGNSRGYNKLFDEVITGPYANAHLLTAVLSPDYVDRNNDGPTFDDLGQYVKFNYSRLKQGDKTNIEWRTPAEPGTAYANRGSITTSKDNTASYTYGEKEIHYLHHIDSKTHRAVFLTSDRDDALPVFENNEGITQEKRLRKLDRIMLFTHAELRENGENAVPIKTAHFEYDPTGAISKGIPNSVGGVSGATGKLTLKSVYFTYADNDRGSDNPYQFSYKTDVDEEHVRYTYRMVDRWGNQIPNISGRPSPMNHPYATQSPNITEKYCDLGNLTEIRLPTGGKIAVDYEPDDYAYVQDKRAGEMYQILGFSQYPNDLPTPRMYDTNTFGFDENLYVHIKVDDFPLTEEDEIDVVAAKEAYFEDVEKLYFEARVELTNNGNTDKITGFTGYEDSNIQYEKASGELPNRIIVQLKGIDRDGEESTDNRALHPITFAGIEKIRLELHRLSTNLPFGENHYSPRMVLAALSTVGQIFNSYYVEQLEKNVARRISENTWERSYIRLAEGEYRKFGDGSRVKEISLSDEWLTTTNPDQTNEYVQRYVYETKGPNDRVISSGVAAMEPLIGKEEMLLVNAQRTSVANALAPNDAYYTLSPVGLPFYPGAQVGYSKVTMFTELEEGYAQSKPGSSIYEYYTAKDFPVIDKYTTVFSARINPTPQIFPFVSRYRKFLGLSQGYVVEVNDMHGKLHRTSELDHYGAEITSTLYKYREEGTLTAGKRKLDNFVKVSTGAEEEAGFEPDYLGMDMEVWIETTENTTFTNGSGAQANIDFKSPVAVPTIWPTDADSETGLYTAVTTKMISRYGILDEVVVTNNGASLATKNHRWDALTGAPLLTSTENEFGQPIYSHTLPARFVPTYEGMGPAYLTEGARYPRVMIKDGIPQATGSFDPGEAFFPGDELFIDLDFAFLNNFWEGRAHVMPGDDLNPVYIVWDDGSLVNTQLTQAAPFAVTVVRSGRCNMLGASAEQTTSLKPLNDGDYWRNSNGNGIDGVLLNFAAVEYDDEWGNMCLPVLGAPEPPVLPPNDTTTCESNPELEAWLNDQLAIANFSFISGAQTLQGINFLERKEELVAACLCDTIFETYFPNGGIQAPSYGFCDINTDTFTIENHEAISDCSFLNETNYWLVSEQSVPLYCTDPDWLAFHDANRCIPGADYCNWPGVDDGPETNTPISTTSCFPWSPTTGGNPYLNGRRGNWRVKAQYVAKQQGRNKSAIDIAAGSDALGNNYKQPLLHQDGTLDNFYPFWNRDGRVNEAEHQLTSEVTAYDDHGHDLETEDALGIPSAAQYGFFQNLPTAVAQNSKRTDLGYDSFEDAEYVRSSAEEVWTPHFSVIDHATTNEGRLTDDEAHTGLYSLELVSTSSAGEQVRLQYSTNQCPAAADECAAEDPCSCINRFAPATAQKYQLSLWVARRGSLRNGNQAATPDAETVIESPSVSFHAEITALDGDAVYPLIMAYPSGPVIEGWQRLTASFDIPENATDFSLVLKAPTIRSGQEKFYVDDLRIHPYESSMVTYAYNPYTLRLMAQMDDNGYAVFYEYDDEGQLIRQKRETERGVMTITEQHTNLAKTNGQ